MPQLHNNKQKQHCAQVCRELQERSKSDKGFFQSLLLMMKIGFMGMNLKPSNSSQWKRSFSPQPETQQVKSNVKSMLISSLKMGGIVPSILVNLPKLYHDVLKLLREYIKQNIWENGAQVISSSLLIMQGNTLCSCSKSFWPKTKWQLFLIRNLHTTMHHVNFRISQIKLGDVTQLRTFKQNHSDSTETHKK